MEILDVLPLFSSPLTIIKLDETLFSIEDFLKVGNEFFRTDANGSVDTYSYTDNWDILQHFPEERNKLSNIFNTVKDDVFQYHSTKFRMTTSWITKVSPGGCSQFHDHKNSMYSAVYYFDDVPSGNIQFEPTNIFPTQIQANNPTEWTLLNAKAWTYESKKDHMIIFPSYLQHRVCKNNSDKDRYSLAMNFFPVGTIGVADSSLIV